MKTLWRIIYIETHSNFIIWVTHLHTYVLTTCSAYFTLLAIPIEQLLQGAVLSTILFTLCIPDIPNTQLALYADDTAILAQSWRIDTIVHRLTHEINILLRYFTKWKLQVNTHKTQAILFKRRPTAPEPLRFNHTAINWSPQVHYLGLILDSKLLFTKHITSVSHRVSSTLLHLFPLLARNSTLTRTNKLLLYK